MGIFTDRGAAYVGCCYLANRFCSAHNCVKCHLVESLPRALRKRPTRRSLPKTLKGCVYSAQRLDLLPTRRGRAPGASWEDEARPPSGPTSHEDLGMRKLDQKTSKVRRQVLYVTKGVVRPHKHILQKINMVKLTKPSTRCLQV